MPVYRIFRLQVVNDAGGTYFKLMYIGQQFPTRQAVLQFINDPQNPFGAVELTILEVFNSVL